MEVKTKTPSPDHTVHVDSERQGRMKEGKIHFTTASFDSDEDWGSPVSDRLTELLERKLPDRKLKEKLTAYRIPANCRKSVGVPKTNQEVSKRPAFTTVHGFCFSQTVTPSQ